MNKLSRPPLYLHSLLTGVLLALGWPAHGFPLLLLIGFVPLLITENYLYSIKEKKTSFSFLWYAYLATLIFNGLTTWWVCNSTIVGGLAAVVCNSFFMAFVLMLFHIVRRRAGNVAGYASLPVFWLAFEYVHLHWQLSWPWLTLGFGFSNYVSLIQWYTLTGPLGGTLWILLCNITVFKFINSKVFNKDAALAKKYLIQSILLVALPMLSSIVVYYSFPSANQQKAVKVVVVQPNIDPYNEKFSGNYQSQLSKMFALASTKVDSTTAYLIFPETALSDPDIWENHFQFDSSIRMVWRYMRKHPHLRLITGAETYRAYVNGEKPTESARKFDQDVGYYDAYNTALQFDSSKNIQVYHKSKLVPGVECMPFSKYLGPLNDAFNLGGMSGTLGTQKEPTVFYSSYSSTTIAPAICYESIYGDYLGEYIKKGAQMIFVITNDGWWKDTPGYKQHLCYGAMLAMETRKQLVQCANTGFSGIINERGDISQRTSWWEPAVIKASVVPNNEVTFYAQHGDYIGLYCCFLSLLLMGYIISSRIIHYFRPKTSS